MRKRDLYSCFHFPVFYCQPIFLYLLSLFWPPVFFGRHTHNFTEKTRKIKHIPNANLIANLINLHICRIQQRTSILYFQQIGIGRRTMSCLLPEHSWKIRRWITCKRSKILQRHMLFHILFHIMNSTLYCIRFSCSITGIPILLNITQRTQEIMKKRRNI